MQWNRLCKEVTYLLKDFGTLFKNMINRIAIKLNMLHQILLACYSQLYLMTTIRTTLEHNLTYCSDAFDMHYGVGILRLAEGLDYSQFAMASYGDDCK